MARITSSPFHGYEHLKLVSLEEAIQPLVGIVPDIDTMVKIVKNDNDQLPDHLSSDESASIRLYTLSRTIENASFYFTLSKTLDSPTQENLTPWFPYLRLFLNALSKLPPTPFHTFFYGIQMDVSEKYSKNEIIIWWDFIWCTASIEHLEKSLDENQPRTIFIIECDSAKDISNYLRDDNQNEFIIYPARQFQVISVFDCRNQLKLIQLKECQPSSPLINIPRGLITNTAATVNLEPFLIERNIHHLRVDLTRLALKDTDMNIIVQHAIKTKQCEQLFLSHNNITSAGLSIITSALINNTTLRSLGLAYNEIDDEGVNLLATVLSSNNSKLDTLSLHSNKITDKGVKYLCTMLEKNKVLAWLYLGKNQISDNGVRDLVDVLTRNKTLKVLSLAGNKSITDASADYFLDLFNSNTSLETLWIDQCSISPDGKEKLQRMAQKNKQLFVLIV